MDTRVIFGSVAILLAATAPALAQFGPGSGSAGGMPSISGAGTGSSAPSGIRPSGNTLNSSSTAGNPNALPGLSTPTPVPAPQVYPGAGAGGVGLPPAAMPVVPNKDAHPH